jgi:thiol-disulfide isomerase/thioredoxin
MFGFRNRLAGHDPRRVQPPHFSFPDLGVPIRCPDYVKMRRMFGQRAVAHCLLAGIFLIASHSNAGDEIGQPAPRFRAKTTAGEQFNNESIKGKIVLFEFWTTWCKYCDEEAELVDDIAKEFSAQGLIVLAVDVLEPDQRVKKYLAEHPRSVPIVLTKDTNLAAMYNAQVYPIYVVIDRDGNIAGEQRGAAGERGLRRMLKRAGLESAN